VNTLLEEVFDELDESLAELLLEELEPSATTEILSKRPSSDSNSNET